jgi:hypothetical protein
MPKRNKESKDSDERPPLDFVKMSTRRLKAWFLFYKLDAIPPGQLEVKDLHGWLSEFEVELGTHEIVALLEQAYNS